ncbi:SUKH-4 family immunity protein [Streptomyces sp. NPDC004609]|uniref:SUKH-4 family immunity protein n=1 Tax=Streptomyces sp. NPDC004609 TaxID=3364704 RepID=UPI003678E7BF
MTEVGVPFDGSLFYRPDPGPLPTLPEEWASSRSNPKHAHLWRGDEQLPPDAEHLVIVGGLVADYDIVVDGRTGALFYTLLGDELTPVNDDISTPVFCLWLYHRERELNETHDFTQDFYHHLADTMVELLAAVDTVACLPAEDPDDYRYWPEVWHDEAGGVL